MKSKRLQVRCLPFSREALHKEICRASFAVASDNALDQVRYLDSYLADCETCAKTIMSSYDHLTKEQLIALLRRREREASYRLVWERDKIEPDKHINDDFVALDLDRSLSCGDEPWENRLYLSEGGKE